MAASKSLKKAVSTEFKQAQHDARTGNLVTSKEPTADPGQHTVPPTEPTVTIPGDQPTGERSHPPA